MRALSALLAVWALRMLALAAAVAALGGQAEAARDARTHSFEGSCAIVGYAVLEDPMTFVPSQSSFTYRGEGRCAGTLDGTVLPEQGVPVSLLSGGRRAVHSCAVGLDPSITWQLTFDLEPPRRDVSIHGVGDIVDVLRSQSSVFHGQRSGTAIAQNTIQGHAETLQRCSTDGVSAGAVGIQMDTVTPLVSGEPAPVNRRRRAR